MTKAFTFIYGILAITISIFLYILHSNLGFPDGHLTELDIALKLFYEIGIGLYLFFALSIFYAGLSKTINNKYLTILKYSFIFSGITALIIYFFMMMHLENGQGG